ncbi:GTP 3',8-cyclase MoaA [Neptunicella marina]|uniref:GTP 3',8-cyclase n=1 Tax=Neptunicella marina TaxID=2125989 RepID=A0A8J6M4N6_9ALTE|nr:GTP 3',8-cyclase MoaA [Neptunicella marina]MBC3766176.1 GTP 3',8-cyclase MoaA [Neptunicella marina]
MLEDKFGRRFHYLRLSITDVCNFRCQYCLPDGYQCNSSREFLTLDEIKQITHAFAALGTSKIRITGGEPALRKDLPQIIQQCANTPGIEQVAITTNGYKLKQDLPAWLDAGISAINVSVDSLDPRQFDNITGFGRLQHILDGIEMAIEAGIKVKLNAVMLKQFNADQLQPFLNWIQSRNVTLRLIELMQTGDNQLFFKQNHISGLPIKQQLLESGWSQIIRNKTAGPAQEFHHPDYQGKIGLIMPYSKDFCASCNRLRISATGKLHLCLFAEQGLDLRELMQEGKQHALQDELVALLGNKQATHWLDKGFTGATSNLAMLGG